MLSTWVHGGDGTVRVDHQLAAEGGGEERAEHLDTDIIVGDTAGLQTKVNEGSRNLTIMEKARTLYYAKQTGCQSSKFGLGIDYWD